MDPCSLLHGQSSLLWITNAKITTTSFRMKKRTDRSTTGNRQIQLDSGYIPPYLYILNVMQYHIISVPVVSKSVLIQTMFRIRIRNRIRIRLTYRLNPDSGGFKELKCREN
jgi:hypothetical protein